MEFAKAEGFKKFLGKARAVISLGMSAVSCLS
jgi:hypothetical protein